MQYPPPALSHSPVHVLGHCPVMDGSLLFSVPEKVASAPDCTSHLGYVGYPSLTVY
ncbi:hypothetical protein [Bacillus clarus]|uniref:hypothetical protein n=1 Tax=Bacillus clarus TaxID=2338372 RepID=UPI000B0F9055|nr:hypothetical protein [Bacillus clarus]